ncbi:rod shape-determining protein MreC [Paucilactobacillus nenjiangensis]|uniref:Cell shape-determining protein MreC n=1 Tax=Paucilactobacillus nenjiangensis TaxID=1296540 RepID=A0A5P1X6D4_9LACO|nr:rod shape-determining protein MreC [Paucilactobacillus nenjiangensis]QER67848.1 rod shape-determining protein MreC [Paucilactobacillus nenjiangensis]
MQKFFSNRRLVVIFVLLILCFGLMAGSVALRNKKSTPTLIQQFGNDIVGFTNNVVSYPISGVKSGLNSVSELMNSYSENKTLKKQVSELAQVKVRDQTLADENSQLKKELKLQKSLTDYSTVTAAVISRTPSSWQSQIVISKGQTDGIRKNMPVLSQSGLIGRVSEVNKTNSKVELLSDSNESSNRFAIQIKTSTGDVVNGIITGYKKSTGQLIMGQVTSDADMKKNDKITTSGMGGVTPKGLYVGKVAKVGKDDYGLAKKIYITPATDYNDLSVVSVAEID